MPLDDYLIGVLFFAATVGCVLAGATLLTLRRLSHLEGTAAALAFGIIATAGLVGVHLLPGLAGVLSRFSALICAGLVLAGAALLTRGEPSRELKFAFRPKVTGPSAAIACLGVGAVALWNVAAAWSGTVLPSSDIDTLTFHLPNVAKWIQTGTVWRTDQFVPLLSNGNYPQNGDVLMLSAVLPFENDAFVRAVGLPFAALAGLSVYALATLAGSRRSSAALFGAAYAAIPVLVLTAYEGAKTDLLMLAMFGAGTYFLLRSLKGGPRSEVLLAGIGLGLAFGTKWYGLWSVGVVLLVWAPVGLAGRRPWRQLALAGAGLLALVGLAGGVWMLRNVILSGSPLYPSPVSVFGITIFDAPRDFVRECGGFALARYLDDPKVLRDFVIPAYRSGYGAPGLAMLLGWALAVFGVVRGRLGRGAREPAGVPLALVAAVPLLAAAYAVTPYSAIGADGEPFVQANLRWLLPALLLGAAAAAWGLSTLGARARLALEVLVLLAVAHGVRSGFDVPFSVVAQVGLGLLFSAALVGAAAWLWRGGSAPRRAAAGAIAAIAAAGALAVGNERQERFNAQRYAGDPVAAVLVAPETSAKKVGLAGVWTGDGVSPILPAFGPRLRREVSFVGPMVRGQLREYKSRERFLAAVRDGGYELLVVGRGTAAYGGCNVPGIDSDEDAWARQAGFALVAQTARLSLYAPTSRAASRRLKPRGPLRVASRPAISRATKPDR